MDDCPRDEVSLHPKNPALGKVNRARSITADKWATMRTEGPVIQIWMDPGVHNAGDTKATRKYLK